MLALREPLGEQPPDLLVQAAARGAGAGPTERQADALAVLAHVVFGAATGGAYALLPRRGAPAVRGVLAALAVYVTSYQGWIPALGVLPPASRDRTARAAVMVLAHVVFGAVLGVAEDRLRRIRRGSR